MVLGLQACTECLCPLSRLAGSPFNKMVLLSSITPCLKRSKPIGEQHPSAHISQGLQGNATSGRRGSEHLAMRPCASLNRERCASHVGFWLRSRPAEQKIEPQCVPLIRSSQGRGGADQASVCPKTNENILKDRKPGTVATACNSAAWTKAGWCLKPRSSRPA